MKSCMAVIAALSALAGCAGPVRTHFGAQSGAAESLALQTIAVSPNDQTDARWPAVAAAIGREGFRVDASSPYQLEFAFGTRSARTAILGEQDAVLAPAKRQRLLQSCADRDYRLVVTVVDNRNGDLVRRGWAQESHCHGTAAEALPALANQAVAMLARPVAAGSDLRRARD